MAILRTGWHKRRGTVIVLAAFLMTLLLGMIAFAVDCGVIAVTRTQLQNAADAGARAGASGLRTGPTAALSAAQSIAQLNQANGTAVHIVPAQDIELGTWNKTSFTFTALTGGAQTGANAARVTCRVAASRNNALGLFFAPILGRTSADVMAQAVAINSPTLCGPFVGVVSVDMNGSYTDSYNSNYGPYSPGSAGSQGHICSNGDIKLTGGSIVHGDAHPGPWHTVTGGVITGSTTPMGSNLVEPAISLGNVATNNDNQNLPNGRGSKSVLDNHGNFSLGAQDNLSIQPGTYYFSSFKMTGGSTLTVTGKTVVYVDGDVDAGGGTIDNTTQLPVNFQFYSTGTNFKLAGNSAFYGVLYAPSADITRNGNSDFFGIAVGRTLTFTGNGGAHYDEAIGYLDGVPPVTQLVQ